jgi:hypothetical protein
MPICPICQSETKSLDKTGDHEGFDCPQHDKFKVEGTVLAVDANHPASREQWEEALKNAKARAKPDGWPIITIYHCKAAWHPTG